MMTLVRAGFVVVLGCSVFACEAGAQSTCVYDAAGRCIAGSVAVGQVVSQPPIVGTVVGQPVVTGGIVGQPVATGDVGGQPMIVGGAVGQPVGSGGMIGGPATYVGTSTVPPAQGQVLPYSYWVSSPARIYVEYGQADQFPFYGRPYGSPNDRWSWYTLGGGSGRYLARYYYPILR